MATRLLQVLQFVNVGPGAQATLSHEININGVSVLPDFMFFDSLNFSVVTSSPTQITVQNNGAAIATLNLALWRVYSADRALGGQIQNLTPQPFVVSGGSGGGSVPLAPITPPALPAGNTNDYAPAGIATATWVRQATNVAGSRLTGIGALPSGSTRLIENLGPGELVLGHDDNGSIAVDQFNFPDEQDLVIAPGGSAVVVYDGVIGRWILSSVAHALPSLNVRDFGAVGDGVTDNRAIFIRAINEANRMGAQLVVPGKNPDGTNARYTISKYIDCADAIGLTISGVGQPTIVYPSDNTAIVADGIALTDQQARSGLLIHSCQNVSIHGIHFEGGDSQDIDTVNIGCAVYVTRSSGTRARDISGYQGYGLYYQDSKGDTTAQGDSLSVVGDVVTLSDASALFRPSHVGRMLTIANATNATNNGVYLIRSYISPTQITYQNATAIAEAGSPLRWVIDDRDQDARVENCRSIAMRGFSTSCPNTVFDGCTFQRPLSTNDATGIGDRFSFAANIVTLFDAAAPFLPQHDGKYITIAGATSGANNGTFRLTYISSTQVSWTNAAGVAELFTNGTWWIMGGDVTGIGAGAGALVLAGTTMTLTASIASFSADDVGKVIRIQQAPTTNNNGVFVITAVLSPTQVTYENALGASEAFSGTWGFDSFDAGTGTVGGSSTSFGSTHGIYINSGNTGRSNISIANCTFEGIRTVAIKVSGSARPIKTIRAVHNTFIECGAAFQGGADDSQEHTDFLVTDNEIIDCATGREGWNESNAISILGAQQVTVHNNHFSYSHNAIGSVSGHGTAELTGIQVGRAADGTSQPIFDIAITGNRFTGNPVSTTALGILQRAIHVHNAGQLAKWGTGGSLTKSGNTMTLTAPAGTMFSQQDVGKSITFVFCANAANNGTFVIETVVNTTTLTFTNAAGVGGGSAIGSYRIPERSTKRGAGCLISKNQIINVGSGGIAGQFNVGAEYTNNTFSGLLNDLSIEGDCSPRITGNREYSIGTLNGHIVLIGGVSWPYIDDNIVTNNAIGSSSSRAMDIAIGAAANRVDYPLGGKRGRAKTADARAEGVIAWGSKHVDGDTITVDGVTYTYKAVITDALTQFNSFASLVALITAQADMDCQDYGYGFHADDGVDGTGDQLTNAAGVTTLTDAAGLFTAAMVGRRITIKGATTAANNGVFVIATFVDVNNVTYANAAGVTEAFAGRWYVDGTTQNMDTQHLHIREVTPSSTDAGLVITVNTLNPTALVMPRNSGSPNAQLRGQGFGSAGPIANRSVAWSLACTQEGGVIWWAANAQAQAQLQANGWRPLKRTDGENAAACEVITHGTTAGTEEWRWAVA